MKIALYVAVAQNGVIGRDGDLPWRLSSDLKRFKTDTMGKPIIMGRKTWDSLPRKPLPGRHNIVVTRDRAFTAEGASVAHGLDAALELARADSAEEAAIIGGASIFAEALPIADRLHVTHVLADIDGDTHLPPIDPNKWTPAESVDIPPGERDSHATRYVIYQRIGR